MIEFHKLIRTFVLVIHCAVEDSIDIRENFLEIVSKVGFVRIPSIRKVNSLTVDIHLNINKMIAKFCLHM